MKLGPARWQYRAVVAERQVTMSEETATPTANPAAARASVQAGRARLEAQSRILEQKERLAEGLPALVNAWGESDPVVTLVTAALVDEASGALVEAAAAAIAGRLAAEVATAEGAELGAIVAQGKGWRIADGFDLVELYRVPVNGAMPGLQTLLPILEAEGATDELRAARLLNVLLSGEHPGDDYTAATQPARLLVEVPHGLATEKGILSAVQEQPRVVGLAGYVIDDVSYRKAVDKLRALNHGTAEGPTFARLMRNEGAPGVDGWLVYGDERERPVRTTPGARTACSALAYLETELGWDVSEAFFIVEHGRVIGVGGWKAWPEPEDLVDDGGDEAGEGAE